MGHATEAYAVSHKGSYPNETSNWIQDLVDAGELSTVSKGIISLDGQACTNATVNNTWCYDYDTINEYITVYSSLESQLNMDLCLSGSPSFVYSSADGRAGVICSISEPKAGLQTFIN